MASEFGAGVERGGGGVLSIDIRQEKSRFKSSAQVERESGSELSGGKGVLFERHDGA